MAVGSQVSIDTVNVSVDTIEPSEPFVVEATLRNAESSDTAARITQVGIRDEGILVTHDDLGTLGTGETMRIPISLTLEDPGQRELTLFVHGRDVGGDPFYLTYPVYATVEEPGDDVRMSVTVPDAVESNETMMNVTVANGDANAISSLELRLGGPAVTVPDDRRVSPTLAAGTDQTFSFDVRFDEPGTQRLTASLEYQTAEGYDRTISESATVDVEPLRVDTELSVSTEQNGSKRNIRATVENFGNVAVEDLVVSVESDGERLERIQGPNIAPGESETVTVDGKDFPEATLTVIAAYEAAEREETVSRAFEFSPAIESRIELTGLDITRSGERLTISGDAANVGETDVTAVLLRVPQTEGVTPVNPSKEYFVGAVDASEFATFQLTAQVASERANVPIEIQYTVDGERRSRVVTVDVGDASSNPGDRSDRGAPGGVPFIVIGSLVVVSILVVAAWYWWRRQE